MSTICEHATQVDENCRQFVCFLLTMIHSFGNESVAALVPMTFIVDNCRQSMHHSTIVGNCRQIFQVNIAQEVHGNAQLVGSNGQTFFVDNCRHCHDQNCRQLSTIVAPDVQKDNTCRLLTIDCRLLTIAMYCRQLSTTCTVMSTIVDNCRDLIVDNSG